MGILGFGKKKPAPSQVPAPVPAGPAASPSPKAKNNFVIVIFDSCRYDTFMEAAPETIQKTRQGGKTLQLRILDGAFPL